ncbi:MAG TPA: HD domain-containing protein [Solirubrobacterales bacterium]|jgi:3'-5' exoribonuclease|nr:HD domain-containing protein [Solirubrobacterales bacterium]
MTVHQEQPRVRIAELESGAEVDAVFACVRKDKLISRNGAPYLSVELRDATGRIGGRAFRDATFLAGQFERGDVVRVAGRVEAFQGARQINLRSIRRVEGSAPDPREFLPTAYRDIGELDGFFEHLAREVYSPQLHGLMATLLADEPLRDALRTAPCTRDGHHAYLGGLLEHTVAVATLAQQTCDLHRKLNSDLVIAAALLHDIGKTREFEFGAEISLTEEGRLLGHLELGAQIIRELIARSGGLDRELELQLLNCVLSHHGAPQGQRFASAEALTLYRVNGLDAQVKGALEHGLSGPR